MGNSFFEDNAGQKDIYQVRLKGQLQARWVEEFEGFELSLTNGDTLLTGAVVDQAALYGLIKKIRDMGLILISINRLDL
ncbi:MAG: hypothetical protein LWX83_12415 [Anaerolineae bacterium]|nr:hypothetical protein [Anaerolineae bacterium]